MDQTLASLSYVDISQVGSDGSGSDSVQCHTNLDTCCSTAQGPHSGERLLFFGNDVNIYEYRAARRVDLRRITATSPSGIYCCEIPTVAVHDNGMRETVCVGLYTSDGGK